MSTTPNLGLTVDVNKNTTTVPDFVDITESNMGLIDTGVGDINAKIPTQATSENQLADKAFVNSSINNLAAYYITRNAQGDPFRTKAELTNTSTFYSGGVTRTPTRNDYCLIQHDESQGEVVSGYASFSTTTQYIGYYVIYNYDSVLVDDTNKDSLSITPGTTICYTSIPTTRYTYNNGWEFQYSLNNTSLTAAQIEAINSGITSTLVGTISANDTTLTNHVANTSNPHQVTAAQVGLGNVDNTSDLNKPISTVTQTALDAKTNLSNIAPTYSASDTYDVGDLVVYNGALYECSTAIAVAEAWDSTHWTTTTVASNIVSAAAGGGTVQSVSIDGTAYTPDGNGDIALPNVDATVVSPVETSTIQVEDADEIELATTVANNSKVPYNSAVYAALQDKADLEDLAPAYDNTSTYAIGDVVSYQGVIYKCSTTVSVAEDFDSTKWTQKTIEELIQEVAPTDGVTTNTTQTITGAKTFDNDVTLAATRHLKMNGSAAIQFPTTGDVQQDVIYRNNNGNLVITSPNGNILTNTGIAPTANNTLDLGASGAAYKDVYVAGLLKDGDNSVSVASIAGKADLTDIAPAYSSSSTYAVGDIVTYGGNVYKCSTAISTAEAWNSSHWTLKDVATLIGENSSTPDLSAYMTKANPTGTGALSINRASGSTTGSYSVAEGYNCTASGDYGAHAEGYTTIASGNKSHAEGDSCTASGGRSHAEGMLTTASGQHSHAEGTSTIAQTKSQHAFGEYNMLDTSGSTTTRGDYVEIVGNGTGNSARSNARALGWNGNEYLNGDLYVNCNADSTGGTKVATTPTIDTASTSPITLTDNTSFRLGTISTLTINTASTYPLDFECEVVFTADSTIAIDYSALTLTWSGDDVSSNVFTPQANKTYNILFFNNATAVATPSLQAIVRGV